MVKLALTEINRIGEITFLLTEEPNFWSDIIPKEGTNILSYWNKDTSQKLSEQIEKAFNSAFPIEFSLNIHDHSINLIIHSQHKQKSVIYWRYEAKEVIDFAIEEARQDILDFSFTKTATAILLVKEDGTLFNFNDAALAMFGYTREEFKQLKVLNIDPNATLEVRKMLWTVLKAAGTFTIHRHLKRKDSTWIDLEVKANIINYKGIELNCAFITDITEKKRLEKELKLVDFIYKNSSLCTIIAKENGSIYEVNQGALKLYGYTREEMLQLNTVDLTILEKQKFAKAWAKAWSELKLNNKIRFRSRNKKKDGSLIDIEIQANYIEYEGIALNCSFITDITEVKKMEDRFKLVGFSFRNATTSMHFVKKDGTILDSNMAAHQLLGYTRREYQSIKIFEPVPYHTPETWEKRWTEYKLNQKLQFDTKLRKKNGSFIDVSINANLITYLNTKILFVSFVDITEKKKIEGRMNLVDFAFRKSSVAIFFTREDASFYDFNEAALSLYGYTKEEMAQLKVDDLTAAYKKEDVALAWANLWASMQEKKTITFNSKHHKKDGSLIDVEIQVNYIEYENIKLNCAYIIDTTDKKRTEEALNRSIERYQYATTATSDVIWETDLLTHKLYLSNNFTSIFGHTTPKGQDMENSIWRQNVHPEDLKRIQETEAEVINGVGDRWEGEYRLKKADGTYAIVLDRSFAIKDENGKAIKMIGSMLDITQRKTAEIEKEHLINELILSNKELKQFSYITTHNLRAPLTNLISICRLLKTDEIKDELTLKLIEGFKTSTNQLNETLNDLINILIIKEKPNLSTNQLNFKDVLDKVVHFISNTIERASVTIASDFSLAENVRFNMPYLESIFLNLLTNSIKYSQPSKPPHIKIYTRKDQGNTTKLFFSDNGVGMNLNMVKDKIFGLYQRFHENADSKGIGLYLIHSQITALGGKIEVESEVNKGTTFIITFK